MMTAQQSSNARPSQPAPTGGLFDRITPAQPAQQSTGLFGGSTSQQPQQTQSNSLFGGSTTQQPQQHSNSLFGGSTTQQPQQTQSNSLFGGSTMQQPQQQTNSLFGRSTTQQPQQQSNSLFGGSTTQQPQQQTSSLFGGSTMQQPQPQQSNSLFGAGAQTHPPQPTSSIFSLTATQPTYTQHSLLGASQYRQSQYLPFSGKLTLGQQPANPSDSSTQVQGAVKIDMTTIRSTTRFSDLVPSVQQDLERMDHMIRAQEDFCRQIEAFIPQHGASVATLAPDVELIADKAEAVEAALSLDAGNIDRERQVLEKDIRDGQMAQRVIDNKKLPAQYHYTGSDNKDMDLIGGYFIPMANDLERTLHAYQANLAEIESHMRTLETSAVGQAQAMAARRGGVAASGSNDTVADLADTLRGFEASILGAAGLVGQCRDGVNGLLLRT